MSDRNDVLIIPAPLHAAMIAHALAELPNECCGILGGDGLGAASIFPLRNIAAEPDRRYDAEPMDLFAVERDLRAMSQHVVGIYHSHPRSEPIPSRTDLSHNHYGRTPHIIISCLGQEPEVRVWRLDPDGYEELRWHISPRLETERSTR